MPTIFISNRHSSEPHDFNWVWPSDPNVRNEHLTNWARTYDSLGVGGWTHRCGYDAYVSMTPPPIDAVTTGGTVIPATGCFDVVTHSTPGLQFYCRPDRHAYNDNTGRWEPGCGRTISLTGTQTHRCGPCSRCGEYDNASYRVESTDHNMTYTLCRVCYEYLTFDRPRCICTRCERVISVNEDETTSFGDGNWCENCMSEYTYTCDVCQDSYDRDNGAYCEYCECCDACSDYCLEMHQENCSEYQYEQNGGGGRLQNYSFTPYLVFHGDTRAGQALFMGVELEVDQHRSRDTGYPDIDSFLEDAQRILTPIQRSQNVDDMGLFYFKEDGSLRNGVEIVSNPATLQFHMDTMPWRSIMDAARDNRLFGHNTDTAGLHIHVSRTGLGISKAEQEYTLAKLVMLMWRLWPELFAFSRRTEETMNQWALPNHMFVPDVRRCECGNNGCNDCMSNLAFDLIKRGNESVSKFTQQKYTAVNTRPRDTLEFRLWRSTLRYDTFMATMQLTKLLIDMSMEFDITHLGHVSWEDLLSQAASHEYTHLWDYATTPEIREKMELVRHSWSPANAVALDKRYMNDELLQLSHERLVIADTIAAADILYQQTINAYTATIN